MSTYLSRCGPALEARNPRLKLGDTSSSVPRPSAMGIYTYIFIFCGDCHDSWSTHRAQICCQRPAYGTGAYAQAAQGRSEGKCCGGVCQGSECERKEPLRAVSVGLTREALTGTSRLRRGDAQCEKRANVFESRLESRRVVPSESVSLSRQHAANQLDSTSRPSTAVRPTGHRSRPGGLRASTNIQLVSFSPCSTCRLAEVRDWTSHRS